MPDFHSGLVTGIAGAVAGFILFTVLGTLPPSLPILAIYAIMGSATVGIIDVMPFWSTTYLIGWVFGNFLTFKGGITDPLEIALYFGAGIAVLAIRYFR